MTAPATHCCAATGCQQTIRAALLMCVDHWRMVPAPLRREVWAAWRAVGRERGGHERYAKAVRAAVDAVYEKQMTRKTTRDTGTTPLF